MKAAAARLHALRPTPPPAAANGHHNQCVWCSPRLLFSLAHVCLAPCCFSCQTTPRRESIDLLMTWFLRFQFPSACLAGLLAARLSRLAVAGARAISRRSAIELHHTGLLVFSCLPVISTGRCGLAEAGLCWDGTRSAPQVEASPVCTSVYQEMRQSLPRLPCHKLARTGGRDHQTTPTATFCTEASERWAQSWDDNNKHIQWPAVRLTVWLEVHQTIKWTLAHGASPFPTQQLSCFEPNEGYIIAQNSGQPCFTRAACSFLQPPSTGYNRLRCVCELLPPCWSAATGTKPSLLHLSSRCGPI